MTARKPSCEPPCIHPDDLIGAVEVRAIAGPGRERRRKRGMSISPNTLAAWRRDQGFPKPIKVLPGIGPGGSAVELWDRRAVREWLRARKLNR